MNVFHRVRTGLPLAAAVLAAGCGGGATVGDPVVRGQGIAVGEPNGGLAVTSEFVKVAASSACTEFRNRLFLIDGKQVFWDRAGNCPDNSYQQTLYGATPEAMLCSKADSIAGPRTTCSNESARPLFDIITKNLDAPDLGLAASGHKVEPIKFDTLTGATVPFETAYRGQFSSQTGQGTAVIKSALLWDVLWRESFKNQQPAPPLYEVDFNTKMVLGYYQGTAAACGGMAIRGVSLRAGKLVVDVEEIGVPADVACPAVVTAPIHLIVVDRSESPVEFVTTRSTSLMPLSLDNSRHSGVQAARDVVVRDQQAYAALWAEHAGKDAAAPAVDFGKQMVLAVFTGPGDGCSSTRIDSVTSDGKQITVRHVDTVPGPTVMCTQLLTTPAHLVAVPASSLPVVFVKEKQRL